MAWLPAIFVSVAWRPSDRWGAGATGQRQRPTATATTDSTRRTAHGWRRVRSSELGVASCDGLFSRSALLRDLSEAKSAGLLRDLSEAKSAGLLLAYICGAPCI
jgi:hypothetical protein